jgi:hypothetical protein
MPDRVPFAHTSCCVIPIPYRAGAVIQSTLSDDQSTAHASALSELTGKASYAVGVLNQNEEDGDDELTFLRLRSKQREVMVSNTCVSRVTFQLAAALGV